MYTHYRDAFLTLDVIESDGEPKLDFPFPIYSQMIIWNNQNRYCYLSKDLIGQKVFAYLRVSVKDEEAVKKLKNYLGDSWKVANRSISAYWTITKEVGLATSVETTDKAGKVTITSVSYAGADKASLYCIHPKLENLEPSKVEKDREVPEFQR